MVVVDVACTRVRPFWCSAGWLVDVAVDVGPGSGGQRRVCGGCASSGTLTQYPSWRSNVELTRNG